MANSFWNHVTAFILGTRVKASAMNSKLDDIEAGFDGVETEINKSIQVTNSPGTVDITDNASGS